MSEIDQWLTTAVQHHRQGDLETAVELYQRILTKGPNTLGAIAGLGVARRTQGRVQDAINLLTDARDKFPEEPVLLNTLGSAFGAAGRWMEAEDAYQEALKHAPDYLEAQANLAMALRQLGDDLGAAEAFANAFRLNPNVHSLALEGAKSFRLAGRDEDARQLLEQLLGHSGLGAVEEANILNDLGNMAFDANKLESAIAYFTRAISLNDGFLEAFFNRANAWRALANVDNALSDYDAAMALQPNHAEVRWNRALTLLLAGRWVEGFGDYAWRWQRDGASPLLPPDLAKWDGTKVEGRLVVMAEQGLGDTLQFFRFLRHVKERATAVTLVCDKRLTTLLSGQIPGVEVTDQKDVSDAVCGVYLMDLPAVLWPGDDLVLSSEAYLTCKDEHRCPPNGRLRVGLVWAGNPGHQDDAKRSIALSDVMTAIADVDCDLVSLQVGDVRRELSHFPAITDTGGEFTDFADTANALSSLDVLITVDTAVAHLAGAMGVPVWVLLPYVPDWRWGLMGETSPWYKTVRLWRQPSVDDWPNLLKKLPRCLDELSVIKRSAKGLGQGAVNNSSP